MVRMFLGEKMFVIANNLGLDLANTRIVDNGKEVDLLKDFDDLMNWTVAVGLLDKLRAEKSRKQWSNSKGAVDLLTSVVKLRDSIKQIAADIAQGKAISSRALGDLNDILKRKSGYFEIKRGESGFEKQFHSETEDIGSLLVPIAESVADLLCFADLSNVKKCEGETCVLYFYDTSKNHRRRWCSMAACGNRAKANAFYHRKKLELDIEQ